MKNLTDKRFNVQKKRVMALIKKWVVPIGLGAWNLKFYFEREPDTSSGKDSLDVLFSVTPDWKYQHAGIYCQLSVAEDIDDRELEEAFVHELMHIYVSPMSTKEKDEQEEYVVTLLAKAMLLAVQNIKEVACISGKKKKSQTQKHLVVDELNPVVISGTAPVTLKPTSSSSTPNKLTRKVIRSR